MKTTIIKCMVWIVLSVCMFSFTRIGGESYTIHLNNKLVVEYYVTSKKTVPNISLEPSSPTDQLSIYYNECGQIGKKRGLTIRDDKDVVLKEWNFADASGEHTPMTIKVKDVLALKQKNIKLFYSSDKVEERLLATVVKDEVKARK